MLALAIILIVVGLCVGVLVSRVGPNGYGGYGYGLGGLLVVVGVILLVLAVLGVAL